MRGHFESCVLGRVDLSGLSLTVEVGSQEQALQDQSFDGDTGHPLVIPNTVEPPGISV